jgi:hypothetical protein
VSQRLLAPALPSEYIRWIPPVDISVGFTELLDEPTVKSMVVLRDPDALLLSYWKVHSMQCLTLHTRCNALHCTLGVRLALHTIYTLCTAHTVLTATSSSSTSTAHTVLTAALLLVLPLQKGLQRSEGRSNQGHDPLKGSRMANCRGYTRGAHLRRYCTIPSRYTHTLLDNPCIEEHTFEGTHTVHDTLHTLYAAHGAHAILTAHAMHCTRYTLHTVHTLYSLHTLCTAPT